MILPNLSDADRERLMANELGVCKARAEKAEALLAWVDMSIRGLLVWAGDQWGTIGSVKAAMDGLFEKWRFVAQENANLRSESDGLRRKLVACCALAASECAELPRLSENEDDWSRPYQYMCRLKDENEKLQVDLAECRNKVEKERDALKADVREARGMVAELYAAYDGPHEDEGVIEALTRWGLHPVNAKEGVKS